MFNIFFTFLCSSILIIEPIRGKISNSGKTDYLNTNCLFKQEIGVRNRLKKRVGFNLKNKASNQG
jgi:hypothetical protein